MSPPQDSGVEWMDPYPLPGDLPAVAEFDFALLPDTIRPWAEDICDRIQCPGDFVGVAIMAGLGALIGRKVGIRPQAMTDWTVTSNQWAMVIGRPGVLKSPAIEAALAPLKRLAATAEERYQEARKEHEAASKVHQIKSRDAEKRAAKRLSKDPNDDVSDCFLQDEETEPVRRRYITNDSNVASLGELLMQNTNGLLVFRDEIASLLKHLDSEANSSERGFYLTGWNGDSSYTFDRIMRGLNLHIPAVCLSLLGGTQPGRISEYISHAIKGGTGDDGLIQRFGLAVWPDTNSLWKDVDRWPDTTAKNAAFEVYKHLDEFTPKDIGASWDTVEVSRKGIATLGLGDSSEKVPDGMPYLRFTPEALEIFLEWRTALETKLRSGNLHAAVESHLAKYRKLVPGLALICHLASRETGLVGEDSILRALAL